MKRLRVLYFASFADAAGCREEVVETAAGSPRELYGELCRRHGFAMPAARVRVAIDGAFADWDGSLAEEAEVVFIPPVSGG